MGSTFYPQPLTGEHPVYSGCDCQQKACGDDCGCTKQSCWNGWVLAIALCALILAIVLPTNYDPKSGTHDNLNNYVHDIYVSP
jgi:hypothetical protein